ncbi:MAG: hypothetical protein AAF253_02175 [Pseudomonadota bacterium]
MSRLKVLAPLGVIALFVAWLLAKDPVALALNGSDPGLRPAAPDYAAEENWLVYPDTPPPTLWEAGWEVDLFVLPPHPKAWHPPGTIDAADPDYRLEQLEALAAIRSSLDIGSPIYTPALRLPSPADPSPDWSLAATDLAAALSYYFDTLNTGRALAVLIPEGDHPLVPALTAALDQRSDLDRARIVTLLALSDTDHDLNAALSNCAYGTICPTRLDVTPRPSLLSQLGAQPPGGIHPLRADDPLALGATLLALKADWLAYLEAGIPKPAEPLGDFETIEVAPVYTPDGERVDD